MRPSSYRAWYAAVPDDFVFAIKGGRFITHLKRLRDVETPLANFFASGLLCLREKLGPILWQLPPNVRFDPDVLSAFFELLPKSLSEIEKLARKHDARLSGRAAVEAEEANRPVWHALEVRHESFADPRYLDVLRAYGIASCVADTAGLYPLIEEQTADFSYARLHGAEQLYVSGYDSKHLKPWVTPDPALASKWAPGIRLLRQRRESARTVRRPKPDAPTFGPSPASSAGRHRHGHRRTSNGVGGVAFGRTCHSSLTGPSVFSASSRCRRRRSPHLGPHAATGRKEGQCAAGGGTKPGRAAAGLPL